ncbi:hypothetical protein [Aquabacterium sp. CECT 9606]|uniref:hypothetical protein n=1 Tax=Aquabacterium sp. CECT 9606 TaxID=2845822 RepID=UPI001E2B95C7|nr:hypothetical protein [Aquabacterium sp. CECT 9606]
MPMALRVAVVQRPVAMDETPLSLLGDGVPGQGPVIADQQLGETLKLFAQALLGVLVMVEVNLNFTQAHAAKIDKRIEVLRAVFFFGVEKRMHRGTPISILAPRAQRWIFLPPTSNARALGFVTGRLPLRLEMIHKAKHEVLGNPLRSAGPPILLEIAFEPHQEVFLSDFQQHRRRGCAQQQKQDPQGNGHV